MEAGNYVTLNDSFILSGAAHFLLSLAPPARAGVCDAVEGQDNFHDNLSFDCVLRSLS